MARSHGSSLSLLQMITNGEIDKLLEKIEGVKVIPGTGMPSKDDHTERELKTYLKNKGYGPDEIKSFYEWWPNSGPIWDFICKAKLDGKEGLILLEAKSHKGETKEAKKSEPDSKKVVDFDKATTNHQRIEKNITSEFNELDGAYKGYYQIANRIAFASKARKVLRQPVLLVILGFINDKSFDDYYSSCEEWQDDMKACLRTLQLDYLLDTNIDELTDKVGVRIISTPCHEDKRHVPQP